MSNLAQPTQNKKLFVLAIMSMMVSAVFSILGAPFLKTFAASTRSRVFWTVGAVFVSALMWLSHKNSDIFQIAVYTGAVWMTLGAYNEFEKRGVSWRYSGLFALVSGFLFAYTGLHVFLKSEQRRNLLVETVNPIYSALQKSFPDSGIELSSIVSLAPGLFVASLIAALAFGFLMEQQIARIFQIKKLKVASGLKWLDFRLPDLFVWTTLFSMLFSIESFGNKNLQMASTNILIISAVAMFFQGMVVIEFAQRAFKFGPFTRMVTYLLVFLQLSPLVAFMGLIDFWIDFRSALRRRIQNKSNTN